MRRVSTGTAANGSAIISDPFSSNPLQAHQHRQLPLHGCGEGQGVAQKAEHRLRRSCLSFVDGCLAVGRVGYDAATTFSNTPAGEEIDPWGAKAAISDVG